MFKIVDETLFIFQAVSASACLLIVMGLLLCPFHGEEFKSYHKARKLIMAALLSLTIQFVVQMMFGLRAKSILYGMACNMFFIYFTAQALTMGMLYLLKSKKSYRKEWTITSVGLVINSITILIGAHVEHGAWLKPALFISYASYFIVYANLYIYFLFEYKKLNKSLQEYFAVPIEEHTSWMKVYIIGQAMIAFATPFTLLHNVTTVVYAFIFYIFIAYLVFKMMYYGHYIKAVTDARETMICDQSNTRYENPDSAQGEQSLRTVYNEHIKNELNKWIKEEGFCDKNVTLITLSKHLGVPSKILSSYINTTIGKSFRDWLNNHRVEYACAFIERYQDRSLEQVADRCGFNSRPYFDTIFKEKVGVTPATYRKRIRSNHISIMSAM